MSRQKKGIVTPWDRQNLFPMSNLGEGGGLLIREAWFESTMGSQTNALLLQLVERTVLEAVKSQFESERGHHGGLVLMGTHLLCKQELGVRFSYPPPSFRS